MVVVSNLHVLLVGQLVMVSPLHVLTVGQLMVASPSMCYLLASW